MDCDRCGKYLLIMYDDTMIPICANKRLHASQPPDKKQRLLCTSTTTTASDEERSTCNESFASNDSVASVEHNHPKPFSCGYTPDIPSLFIHNWAFAAHGGLQPLTFMIEQSKLRVLDYEPSVSIISSQTLTEEEVLKYALCKEEYVGVLGKEYAAKNQERRLAMDLTKLNSDATLVTNPALFCCKVVLVQDR